MSSRGSFTLSSWLTDKSELVGSCIVVGDNFKCSKNSYAMSEVRLILSSRNYFPVPNERSDRKKAGREYCLNLQAGRK